MFDRKQKLAMIAGSASLLAGTMVGPIPVAHGAQDWTLRTTTVPRDSHCAIAGPERKLRKLGPVDVDTNSPAADTMFRDFKRVVGRPEEVDQIREGGLTASYLGGHAGRFAFVSFGDVERPGQLQLQYATLTGRRWVTGKGVRVGSTLTRIKQRYGNQAYKVPDPLRKGTWWRLAGHCGYPLVDGPVNVIEARITGGRVSALMVWIGAAGD